MSRRRLVALVVPAALVVAVITVGSVVHAFINPDFTPVHLTEQSELVLVLEFSKEVKDGKATAKVTKALKGKAPAKPITVDLMAGAFKARGEQVGRIISSGNTRAMLFVGFFEDGGEEEGGGGGGDIGDEEETRGKLHVGGKWVELLLFEEQTWDLVKISNRMEGTWAGSTDMLQRCVEYILEYPDEADVPVRTEAEWAPAVRIGSVAGTSLRAMRLELVGRNETAFLIPSQKGDRLFARVPGTRDLKDVTAERKLASRSVRAARVNVGAQRGDSLVSFDGKVLKLYVQEPDGTFGSGAPTHKDKLPEAVARFPDPNEGDFAEMLPPKSRVASAELAADEGGTWRLVRAGATAVDLAGDGKLALHVSCTEGDRLFAWDAAAGSLKDITAGRKLASKSLCFAWGHFDAKAGGGPDLVSFDGKVIALHTRLPDGSFKRGRVGAAEGIGPDVRGLAALDGGGGRSAILVSTGAAPVLLKPAGDSWTAEALAEGKLPVEGFGNAGPCLAADFDGDALCDVMQLFATGGLFYGGRGPAAFKAPVRTQIALGKGRSAACLGDYDHDGLMDVACVSEGKLKIWQNLGKARFVDLRHVSGEINYISDPGGTGVQTCDVNNDGRQDVLIIHPNRGPQIFFSRGFRSFGHAHAMDVDDKELLKQIDKKIDSSCQAGCIADFTGDGAQDMALVLRTGEVFLFPRKVDEGEPALALTVALSPAGGWSGPLNVSAEVETRSLGSWTVRAGQPGAFFGAPEAGPVTVRWREPGGRAREKEVILEDRARRYVIRPEKK